MCADHQPAIDEVVLKTSSDYAKYFLSSTKVIILTFNGCMALPNYLYDKILC